MTQIGRANPPGLPGTSGQRTDGNGAGDARLNQYESDFARQQIAQLTSTVTALQKSLSTLQGSSNIAPVATDGIVFLNYTASQVAQYFDGNGTGKPGQKWYGWQICNGYKGTPNLLAKFPRLNSTAGATGGADSQASNVTSSANTGVGSSHTHSVPAHYHDTAATGATITMGAKTSGAGSAHYHEDSMADANNACWGYGADTVTGGVNNGTISHTAHKTSSESAHTHSISFSHADFSGLVGLVTGGVSGDAAMTSGSEAAHTHPAPTLTNNAVENRPAFYELVPIMRVQ